MLSLSMSRLINHLRAFRADEDGAATVDFVVLTSSVVLLALAHVKDVADASVGIADNIDSCLSEDIADLMIGGDPDTYIQNMQAAAAACSAR